MAFLPEFDIIELPTEPPKPIKRCTSCYRSWSTYLDAYYGRDSMLGSMCGVCRIRFQRSLQDEGSSGG